MTSVLACVDADHHSVCESAIWSTQRLRIPLHLLHALSHAPSGSWVQDLSSHPGFEAEPTLVTTPTPADLIREQAALQHAEQLLQTACQHTKHCGHPDARSILHRGSLLDALRKHQDQIRLIVMGQKPIPGTVPRLHLDSEVERAVRGLHKPILITPNNFRAPTKVAIAFDGSDTGRRLIQTLAASPLLQGLPLVLLTAGQEHHRIQQELHWALDTLQAAGFSAEARHQSGLAENVILDQVDRQGADLLVMGAYGHSRLRELIVGSVTKALLRTSPVPVLVLR